MQGKLILKKGEKIMSRNINTEEIRFPVELRPVYTIYTKGKKYSRLSNYSAVTGIIEKEERVFSVVSRDYKLILNEEAIDMGKSIFKRMFPRSGNEDFEIFNIKYPASRSFCHIDLINSNYTLNIWDKEVYIPFIRITNSYNKSRKLRFELGFCREVCDNGVIFEREFVSLNYFHYGKSIGNIQNLNINDLKFKGLRSIENRFIKYMKSLEKIKVEEKYFIPVTAKIFGLKFKTENVSERYREIIERQKDEFLNIMKRLKQKYAEELGENAYSLFNTATAFANEPGLVNCVRYNDYQTKAGQWVKEIVRIKNKELIQKYLDNCIDYLN